MKTNLILTATVAIAITACAPSEAPAPATPPSPSMAALPAAPPAAPATVLAEMPVTSRSPQAVEEFKKGRDREENFRRAEAVELMNKALQLDPDFAQAHANLAFLLPEGEGAKHLERAVALSKALPEPERLLVESIAASKRGEPAKAQEIDMKIAALLPRDWRAHLALAGWSMGQAKLDEAEAHLKTAIGLNPSAGPAYNLLGYAYARAGKTEPAIAAFRKYAEVSPSEPNAHDSLADAYLMASRLDEAEASYRKATEANPGFFFAWQGVAQTRFLRGDWAAGREALGKAKASSTRPSDKLDMDATVAWSLLSEGKTAEATKAFEAVEKAAEAQKLPTTQAFAGISRAVVLLDAMKSLDALKQVDAALERAPKAGVAGDDLDRVRRFGLEVRSMVQARLKGQDPQKTVTEMEELARKNPKSDRVQSSLHFVRGMSAWAGGGAKAALPELSQCVIEDATCQWQLALAQEAGGDKPGAEATRTRLVGTPRRDTEYLYARTKLVGKAPIKAKSGEPAKKATGETKAPTKAAAPAKG